MDLPPLPFQLQDPERVRHVLADAGLKDVHVETTTEKLEFRSGAQLWDWLVTAVARVTRGLHLADGYVTLW
jgi:hypothetical protein